MSHVFWISGKVLKDMGKGFGMTEVVTKATFPILKSHSEAKQFILNE